MSSNVMYFWGACVIRSITIRKGWATINFSSNRIPVGSDIEPPSGGRGSVTLEHDPGVPVSLILSKTSGEDNDGMTSHRLIQFDEGEPDDDLRVIGFGELTREAAVRKNADGAGGETIERRFSVEIKHDTTKADDDQELGTFLNNKRLALCILYRQGVLPMDEDEAKESAPTPKRRKKGADQEKLPGV